MRTRLKSDPGVLAGVRRQAISDLRRLYFSKQWLVIFGVVIVAVGLAYVGARSFAETTQSTFVTTVNDYQANGISLDSALSAPVEVSGSGGNQTITNPLRFDFEGVAAARNAVTGLAFVSTALDVAIFLVLPLLLLFVGGSLALSDRAAGTTGLRAAREGWARVVAGRLVAGFVVGVGAISLICGAAAAAGLAGPKIWPIPDPGFDFGRAQLQAQPFAPKVAFALAVAVAFLVLGYLLARVSHTMSWPFLVVALALFVLPIVVSWDPRNLMAAVGRDVLDFWGQFKVWPTVEVDPGRALMVGLAEVAAMLLVVLLTNRRVPAR